MAAGRDVPLQRSRCVDDAAALFDAGYATDFGDLPRDMTWLQSMSYYADCAADMGRADAASMLYERILPHQTQVIFVVSNDRGPVARALGRLATQLGRYDEADTHLRRALEVSERMHAPYWIARTQLDLAELCIARQHPADSETARDLIQTARGSAQRHGYGGLLPRIERLFANI